MQVVTEDGVVKKDSLKAWVLAARPKTLSGAAVPVMIGLSLAWTDAQAYYVPGTFNWVAAALCILFAFIMQIDANFINDFVDYAKGTDDRATRLGPERACAQGWVSTEKMKRVIAATTCLACLVGLPLVWYGGLEMIVIGILCVVFCFLYTTHLSYMGLGDVLVVVFFGLIPCCLTYYVIVPEAWQRLEMMPWMLGLANGLMTDTLLLVNNYRDIDNDRNAGKKTLVVLIGKERTEWLFLFIVPVALCIVLFEFGWTNLNIILCFGVYFFHISTWNEMRRIGQGRALNGTLGKTARNILFFGILISLLVILSK